MNIYEKIAAIMQDVHGVTGSSPVPRTIAEKP